MVRCIEFPEDLLAGQGRAPGDWRRESGSCTHSKATSSPRSLNIAAVSCAHISAYCVSAAAIGGTLWPKRFEATSVTSCARSAPTVAGGSAAEKKKRCADIRSKPMCVLFRRVLNSGGISPCYVRHVGAER